MSQVFLRHALIHCATGRRPNRVALLKGYECVGVLEATSTTAHRPTEQKQQQCVNPIFLEIC